ncbi:helix-turn-helix transcriptional regulator [uncultured Tateyamaria sp.]|uniref:helix-turn-helix domain-containing protein n=1 Tax=uncultured Tateyamaria sp. TaxID=455651 RepID=UPI0026178EA6|nr:helix-turn-helix transcriptional regulator [uncultured Tateyamaria sp.]
MEFRTHLAHMRRRARMSQLDLAHASNVSQRHISFLESGRANPGADVVARLSAALNLPFSDINLLYDAAGYRAPRPTFEWEEQGFSTSRSAIEMLLAHHAPFPALATFRCGSVLTTNEAYDRLIDHAFADARAARPPDAVFGNLFDLTLHPRGLIQFMVNPEDIVPHTLRRLRAAAERSNAASILRRVENRNDLLPFLDQQDTGESMASSVLIERYRVGPDVISLVSMVAGFGSPEDVTAQEIQIELLFPADDQTQAFFGTESFRRDFDWR